MSPNPPFVLVCPQCRRRFRGDPAQPDARYRCPDDRSPLERAEQASETVDLATARKMTVEIPGGGDPAEGAFGSTQPGASPARPVPPTPAAQQAPTQFLSSGGGSPGSMTGSLAAGEARRSVLAALGVGAQAPGVSRGVDKYETVGELGKGGMGEVLKVVDKDLKREVALKRMRGGKEVSSGALLRFVEEAQATGQLEHPNIVPVHDLGVDAEGQVYFTLKFVQGDSFKKVLKGRIEKAPLDSARPDGPGYADEYNSERMIAILIDICQGVAYAHAKGVIHRDLKPDNVMLGKFGEVLVMDWGLAKVVGRPSASDEEMMEKLVATSRSEDESAQTVAGAVAGTPAYMAPEQAEGKVAELDQRTDVYALGALLYEILSGRAPYRGPGALAVVERVKQGPPPPLKNPGGPGFARIPRELKAICEKAMARAPEARYQSAVELRDDLQAWLEHREVKAAPDTVLQKLGKWARRNRRLLLVSGTTAAVVIGGTAGALYGAKRAKIAQLMYDAEYAFKAARDVHQKAGAGPAAVNRNDPYAGQILQAMRGDSARIYRDALQGVVGGGRKVLELSPRHAGARSLLADAFMEQWRLALAEDNKALMQATRAEVERFTDKYRDELNGWGSFELKLSPPGAEAWLYGFEPFKESGAGASGTRWVPVPYDWKSRSADRKALLEEQKRWASDSPEFLPGENSIFRFADSDAAKLGSGAAPIKVAGLPPGSYLLHLKNGAVSIRVPFTLDRGEKVSREIAVPAAAQLPGGFVFIAPGGQGPVGGYRSMNAGALDWHAMSVAGSLIAREEITMGEYAAFLADLAKKSPAEAAKHFPHDFGTGNAIVDLARLKGDALVPCNNDLRNKCAPETDDAKIAGFAKSSVRGVTLDDARAYLVWRSAKDNLPYRLPKDWEWELACRGVDGRQFSWGDQPAIGFATVTQGYGGGSGAGISWGWKKNRDESVWGVHNLAGGAAEWTGSLYNPGASDNDPVKGQFAIRGNAWSLPPVGLMCNFRTSGQPGYFHPTIGFRFALDFPFTPGVTTAEQAAAPLTEQNHAGHQH